MKNPGLFEKLVGEKVKNSELDAEGGGIWFASGVNLAIYNEINVTKEIQSNVSSIQDALVRSVEKNDDSFDILFDNGARWSVNLSIDAYKGPEAMHVKFSDGLMVVWRQYD